MKLFSKGREGGAAINLSAACRNFLLVSVVRGRELGGQIALQLVCRRGFYTFGQVVELLIVQTLLKCPGTP